MRSRAAVGAGWGRGIDSMNRSEKFVSVRLTDQPAPMLETLLYIGTIRAEES